MRRVANATWALPSESGSFAERLGHCLGFGVHLELRIDVAQVKRNGVDGDGELVGGCLVVVTLDEQAQQLGLLRCQVIRGPFRGAELAEEANHAPRHLGRHRRSALDDFTHGLEEPGWGSIL